MKDENILNDITHGHEVQESKTNTLSHTAARYIPLKRKKTKLRFFFLIFILYWVADLQCCISLRCTAKWFGTKQLFNVHLLT